MSGDCTPNSTLVAVIDAPSVTLGRMKSRYPAMKGLSRVHGLVRILLAERMTLGPKLPENGGFGSSCFRVSSLRVDRTGAYAALTLAFPSPILPPYR